MAAEAVSEENKYRDDQGMSYALTSMLRCGFAKKTNSLWEIRHIFPHFQTIISKYRINFDGLGPDFLLK